MSSHLFLVNKVYLLNVDSRDLSRVWSYSVGLQLQPPHEDYQDTWVGIHHETSLSFVPCPFTSQVLNGRLSFVAYIIL